MTAPTSAGAPPAGYGTTSDARPAGRARVVALVLNWNGAAILEPCVASVTRSRDTSVHTVIVDNGSTDGSAERVAAIHPGVEVLALGANLGYARGMNRGLAHARALGAE